MTTAALNGMRAVSVRLLTPWRGVWTADVILDTTEVDLTNGPATLVIGALPGPIATLQGTIDPRFTGVFVERPSVRVVGGAGGWDNTVTAQHFHADGGVVSTQVYQATAGQVGETVVDPLPQSLGFDFVRSAGPASRVFADVDWWVDALGVTHVGSRPAPPADPTLTVLSWDPAAQRAELTADSIIQPGAVLSDPRIGPNPVTVRDVEQTFDGSGTRATAWCSAMPVSRFMAALGTAVRELAGIAYLKLYRYRVVLEGGDGRLQLQAVQPTKGLPDTLPLRVWTGMSGITSQLKLSSEVLVEFVSGDPAQPIVRGFSTEAMPVSTTIDATSSVLIGPSAGIVALAGGAGPLVLDGPYTGLLSALATLANALAAMTVAPLTPIGTAGGIFKTALQALPSAATTKVLAT